MAFGTGEPRANPNEPADLEENVMTSSSWILSPHSAPPASPGELMTDYRSRLALEQFQAAERRERELAEQSSALNAPEVRIRAWEQAHGLKLPRDAAHPVLSVVAAVTHLTLEQVHEEQRRRSAPVNRAVAGGEPKSTPSKASEPLGTASGLSGTPNELFSTARELSGTSNELSATASEPSIDPTPT
jgi:hypothetical protein